MADDFMSAFVAGGGDPVSGIAGKAIGAALSHGPTVSGAQAGTYGTTLDGSGWSLNFGSGSQIATPPAGALASYNDSAAGQQSAGVVVPQMLPQTAGYGGWLGLAALALIAVRLARKHA